MILSFHPRVPGDVNLRLPRKRPFTAEQAEVITSAKAVVFTQHVKDDQYRFCRSRCEHLFPDYTYRFGFEGKYGNIQLFRKFDVPHPKTVCYESVETFQDRHFKGGEPLMAFPFVLKGDRGGGGWAVFLVRTGQDLKRHLKTLGNRSLHPTRRFIVQAFVPHGGRDLRVVALGHITKAYWRCQHRPGEFRNNVGRGAVIDYHVDPHLAEKGIGCVRDLCSKTGIDLAAFDVLFDRRQPEPQPLLSEINFLFGRKGLGGSSGFHDLLNRAVQQWIEAL